MAGKCINCGKTAYENRLCKDCFFAEHDFVKEIKEFYIYICRKCGRWGFFENRLYDAKDAEAMLRKKIKDSVVLNRVAKIKDMEISFDMKDFDMGKSLDQKKFPVVVSITGTLSEKGKMVTRDYEFEIAKRSIICGPCSKKSSRYFEGILQLRDVDDSIVNFVIDDIKNHHRNIFITQKVKLENGVDLFVSDKKYLKNIVERLYSAYGGEFKLNAQHFSEDRQTMKFIYRVNALFRPSPYRKDMIVEEEGILYKVLVISKNRMTGLSFKDKKEKSFNLDMVAPEVVEKRYVTHAVQEFPKMHVLHPLHYSNVAAENPSYVKKKIGENICVALDSLDRVWIVE